MARWIRQQQKAEQHPGHSNSHAVTAVGAAPPVGVKGGPAKTDRQMLRVGLVLPAGYHSPATLDNDGEMESDDKEWEKFKTKFHKQYATPSEESYRFAVFKLALQAVRTHNKKYQNHEVSWCQGINQFTDLTQQEFESKNNLKPPQGHEHDGEKLGSDEEEWIKFKTRFNRHYSSPKEEARRKNIFLATLKVIRDHNEKYNRYETSWRQGVNQFADLTLIETSYIMIKPQLGTYSGVPEQKPEDQQEHTGNIEKVEDDDEAWQKFKKDFDRHYPTSDEENFRKGIFMATLEGVREHNKTYKTKGLYSQGINEFFDLTQKEFAARYTMRDYVRRRAGLTSESQPQSN
ncbi:unnamed protein product [Psylliodes chrysocephalus]|nr:unnamed protein product [Psylliodes chrysocephala]